MFKNRVFRDAELLHAGESLPVLSPGLRSRVLAAALEAQDRRAQGRRVLASALGLFAMLAGVAWLGPFAGSPFSDRSFIASDASTSAGSSVYVEGQGFVGPIASEQLVDAKVAGDKNAGRTGSGAKAASTVSSFSRGQGLMSMMGDDWRSVEDQLRSRQEHFPRFQM